MWAYDAAEKKWTRLEPKGPPPPSVRRPRKLCYFDPVHNVFVFNQGTATWVYRYKAAEKE